MPEQARSSAPEEAAQIKNLHQADCRLDAASSGCFRMNLVQRWAMDEDIG